MLQTAEKKKTEQRCLTAALVFNALFLALALLLCRVGFESNDDLTLAAFVDGQMAVPTAHIPYINIVLGVLLKGIYTVLGRGAAWHTLCQMLLLYLSFAAMSYVLCRRLGVPGGLVASAALLLFAGLDVYTIISYTKTAAVCTVGGMLLLTDAMERERGRGARIAGTALCLFGFMLRPMEFLPCFGILAALCFRWLWGLLFEQTGTAGEKAKRLLRAAAPFLLVAALCGGALRGPVRGQRGRLALSRLGALPYLRRHPRGLLRLRPSGVSGDAGGLRGPGPERDGRAASL